MISDFQVQAFQHKYKLNMLMKTIQGLNCIIVDTCYHDHEKIFYCHRKKIGKHGLVPLFV